MTDPLYKAKEMDVPENHNRHVLSFKIEKKRDRKEDP